MTQPMSRTELAWRVDYEFHVQYPDAPQQLSASDPAHDRWRELWLEERDKQLNAEVDRVYWARHPDAPAHLDENSPEWEPWREEWRRIWYEVMDNAPSVEDVQIQSAVSEDRTLDLSHLKAMIRAQLIEFNQPQIVIADTLDRAIELADRLCEDVGEQAMRADTVNGSWESPTESLRGLGDELVELKVTGWWGDGQFVGTASIFLVPVDNAQPS